MKRGAAGMECSRKTAGRRALATTGQLSLHARPIRKSVSRAPGAIKGK